VFRYGLSSGEGPGLIFMTLPIAFDQMPGGGMVGSLFFLMLFVAALTSSISLLEAVLAHLVATLRQTRMKIALAAGLLLLLASLATVFSFNIWQDFRPLAGKTLFELLDYAGSNLLMPVGGILMAVIAGWLLPAQVCREALNVRSGAVFACWRVLIRYVAPLAVLAVFISNLR